VFQDSLSSRPSNNTGQRLHSNLHRPSQHDRPHRTDGLGPIPEAGLAATELFVDQFVTLFEVANDGIAVLSVEEEIEKEFSVDGVATCPYWAVG
jgi:hypothetical protein